MNASNGRGSHACAERLHLQYATHGLIASEAKATVCSCGFFPHVCGLPCNCVFHAVTMRNPALRSSVKVVRNFLISLRNFCMEKGFCEIALPMFGCRNGKVAKEDFLSLVDEIFYDDFWEIKVVNKEI